jgi:hypothetical protein
MKLNILFPDSPLCQGANPLQEISAKAIASHVKMREALGRLTGRKVSTQKNTLVW